MSEGSSSPEVENQLVPVESKPPSRLRQVTLRFVNKIRGLYPNTPKEISSSKYEPTFPERFENDARQHAYMVEQQLGKVPDGFVRLYRGVHGPVGPASGDEFKKKGTFFSNRIDKAQTFTGSDASNNGYMYAVDVPFEDLARYAQPSGYDSSTGKYDEFVLPVEVAEAACPIRFKPEGGYSRYGMNPELAGTEASRSIVSPNSSVRGKPDDK